MNIYNLFNLINYFLFQFNDNLVIIFVILVITFYQSLKLLLNFDILYFFLMLLFLFIFKLMRQMFETFFTKITIFLLQSNDNLVIIFIILLAICSFSLLIILYIFSKLLLISITIKFLIT